MCDENVNYSTLFFISAYTSPMCLEIIRRNDAMQAKKVFKDYCRLMAELLPKGAGDALLGSCYFAGSLSSASDCYVGGLIGNCGTVVVENCSVAASIGKVSYDAVPMTVLPAWRLRMSRKRRRNWSSST